MLSQVEAVRNLRMLYDIYGSVANDKYFVTYEYVLFFRSIAINNKKRFLNSFKLE
jgi:hypothetical protein